MFVPVSAENEDYARPYVTYAIILLCSALYVLDARTAEFAAHAAFWEAFAFHPIDSAPGHEALTGPARFLQGVGMMFNPFRPAWLTAISSAFLHDGCIHLASNMTFLWLFGASTEHIMGHVRYICFFIAIAFLSQLVQIMAGGVDDWYHIGSSGAVAGVLGAYVVYFPRTKINAMLMGSLRTTAREFRLPAYWLLPLHFLSQFEIAFGHMAVWAHIGGYALGGLLALPFKDPAFMYKAEADRLFGADGEKEHKITPELVDDTKWTRAILKRPPLSEMRKKGKEEAHRRKTRGNDWYKDKK